MADLKISELTNLTAADPANDMIPIVDVSATPPASGSTKRISINNILACSPTATLASATISGALTVDTTTLVVNPAGYPDRVGIGTATPAVTLDISDPSSVIRATSSTGTNTSFAAFANTGGAVRVGAENSAGGGLFTGSSAYSAVLGTTGAYSAHIGTSGAVRMTVDSTGNVGIGVTPSAWSGTFKMIETLGGSFGTNSNGALYIPQNATFNSGWLYKNTLPASYYTQAGGAHQFFNAPSGTAGTSITFTQAMTLDASGNLLVGTTAAAGSASNSTKTVGGLFSTINGSTASTASGAAVTMFTSPAEATFMVSAYIFGTGAPASYNAIAIVKVSGSTAAITTVSSATGLTISLSGLNVQVTQTSGSAQVMGYSAIRIS